MPVRRSPSPRRVAAVVIAAVVAVAGLAVLTTRVDAFRALGERQAIVHFRDGTPVTERAKVAHACAEPPAVRALPFAGRRNARYNDVHFRVDDASDAAIVRLSTCLQRFPSVSGLELTDLTGG